MIPLRLELRNFLCYRENVPTLDFTGIHLACLCGPNGHGKSALLDAITWCLWGKARARSQDALISFGAEECRVQLDFSSRAETYRVIRSHIKGGGRRQQGATDLQLQSLPGGDPVALTGNTIRESQAKIDRTVGMDYETFINSAFLLQGRADEFTNKPPADRKAVLAKVLSLETYDLLQARARERLSRVTGDGQELSGRLAEMRRQADDIGDPTEEIAEADLGLSLVNQGLELHRQEAGGLARSTHPDGGQQTATERYWGADGGAWARPGASGFGREGNRRPYRTVSANSGSGRAGPGGHRQIGAGQGRPGPVGTSPPTLR